MTKLALRLDERQRFGSDPAWPKFPFFFSRPLGRGTCTRFGAANERRAIGKATEYGRMTRHGRNASQEAAPALECDGAAQCDAG